MEHPSTGNGTGNRKWRPAGVMELGSYWWLRARALGQWQRLRAERNLQLWTVYKLENYREIPAGVYLVLQAHKKPGI